MKKQRYSENFTRDFNWYLKMRNTFNFDGRLNYEDKIIYSKKGVDAKKAFLKLDSEGIVLPTKHPNILESILKTKGGVNLHIKMYGQDLANQRLTLLEFRMWCIYCWQSPDWFREAVQRQRYKILANNENEI